MENAQRDVVVTGKKRFMNTSKSLAEAEEPLVDPLNPHLYTSGRWLHRDKLQRVSRYIQFNFSALCEKILEVCYGANKIVRYEKKEGGYNRVFIFYMDNGARMVARLPFRIAGPARLATNSEVATMTYIRKYTNIPVPEVLDWSDNNTNSIGTEYIIMEHAPGVQLHRRWPSMDTHQHMLCVKCLATLIKEMANIPFLAYGSLYFADAPIDPRFKVTLGDFCVGPHCGTQYWDCNVGEVRFYGQRKPNRGPWFDLRQYCSGLFDAGFSRIPSVEDSPKNELAYRGSVQEHLGLLRVSEDVIEKLIQSPLIQDLATPTLLHPDLHKRNIFVSDDDPTRITALIDWQSASIDPVFAFANETPDLIVPPTQISVFDKIPETASNKPEIVEEKAKYERDISICRQTFEVSLRGWVPKLYAARATDETLLRPFRYCHTSWRDSAAALRQELIELSQRWNELGLPGLCPYQPSAEELAEHAKQYEDFQTVQKLKLFLINSLDSNSDGWVPLEAWEAAKEAHKAAFEEWMQTAREIKDSAMTEERAEKLWPFDAVKDNKS